MNPQIWRPATLWERYKDQPATEPDEDQFSRTDWYRSVTITGVSGAYRGIRRGGIQLADRGLPLFGELLLAPSADDPNPLAWRGAAGLVAEHRQRLAQRLQAIPAQLQQVVQRGPDHVYVRVDQARDYPPAHRVDHAGDSCDVPGHAAIVAAGQYPAVADR